MLRLVVLAHLALGGGLPHAAFAAAVGEPRPFARCGTGPRVTCVVDGDTFWYRGTKIRIADINAPEVSTPACPVEAALGERATRRLGEWLAAGPFKLRPVARDVDRYGRKLRLVTRAGSSVGAMLEAEGLAQPWRGRRGDWCAGRDPRS